MSRLLTTEFVPLKRIVLELQDGSTIALEHPDFAARVVPDAPDPKGNGAESFEVRLGGRYVWFFSAPVLPDDEHIDLPSARGPWWRRWFT